MADFCNDLNELEQELAKLESAHQDALMTDNQYYISGRADKRLRRMAAVRKRIAEVKEAMRSGARPRT